MTKTALVTTGATVTFKQLIILSLTKSFLHRLISHGFSALVIQFGGSSESKELFIRYLSQLGIEHYTTEENEKITVNATFEGILIEGINFDKDLTNNYTRKSSLVISHGGSGSILDSLRLDKKLIVLNNDELSEGHQMDIINEFLRGNHLVYCNDNYNEETICRCVDEVMTKDLAPIKPSNGKIIQRIIMQTL